MVNRKNSGDTSHYEGALLEDILDRVKAIAEGLTILWDKVDALDQHLNKRIDDVFTSLTEAIKEARVTTNDKLENHEQRITKLEQKTAT